MQRWSMPLSVLFACWLAGCDAESPSNAAGGLQESLVIGTAGARRDEPAVSPWVPHGLGGGGALFSPTISPHDPSQMFAATDVSATFRTDDLGASWTMLPFEQIQGGIGTEVRFTSNPRILYSITIPQVGSRSTPQTPVRSLDGGRTFKPLAADPTGGQAWSLFVDRKSVRHVLVSDYANIYYSDDGAESFRKIWASDPDRGVRVAGAFWQGRRIFVGTQDGLLVSTDDGASFALAPVGGIPATEAMTSMAGAVHGDRVRLFAVTGAAGSVSVESSGLDAEIFSGVYRLDWDRATWVPVMNGITAGMYPFYVGMADTDVDIAYLAGATPNLAIPHPLVLKTTDGGASWAEVFLTTGNRNIATGYAGEGGDPPFDWSWPERALGLAVSPKDPKHVLLTDFGFGHVTSDGGATWHQVYEQKAHENPIGSVDLAGKPYATNGLDPTSSWWITFVSAGTILISSTDIRGSRSTDGGATWTTVGQHGLPHNTTYQIIKHPKTGVLYAATSTRHDAYMQPWLTDAKLDPARGYIMASSDDGSTFTKIADLGHGMIWLAVDPNDPETMYASMFHSTLGGIFVTHNLSAGAAASWTQLAKPPRTEGHPFNIQVLRDGRLVATYSGRRLANGSFTPSSGVFVSSDGGASWQDRSDPAMMYWTKDITIDPCDPRQESWYVGVFRHFDPATGQDFDEGGLYRTIDAGLHWQRLKAFKRAESVAIAPHRPNLAVVATESEGLWVTFDLHAKRPVFFPVTSYPFQHPNRAFFDPYDTTQVWVTSFGGGVKAARLWDLTAAERGR